MTRSQHRREVRAKLAPIKDAVDELDAAEGVKMRVGGAMEYDPRQGEAMVPNCVEFKLTDKSYDVLERISDICDEYNCKVILPDYHQPDFSYTGPSGEERVVNTEVDYEALVRLIHNG